MSAREAMQQAREDHEVVVRSKAQRHADIAAAIRAGGQNAKDLIRQAMDVVNVWREQRLCSNDYVDGWTEILAKPAEEIAAALESDSYVVRQTSPFVRAPQWYAVRPALVESVVDQARRRIGGS